jgi:formylglycine-generating enzyme required for sulfatase activity
MTQPTDLRILPVGQALSDYRIEGVLGQGGFGITYLATDTNLGRKVAIKEYYPREYATRDSTLTIRATGNAEDRETFNWGLTRFLEEARILARFEHPNIVAVRRFFEANGTAYLVMDYCDGEPLDEVIKRNGPLSKDQLERILLPLLDGLEEIHSTNFLHRDIKPANIFIRRDGSPVLLDFGAARQETGNHSRSVTSLATAGYAAVEQYSTKGKQGPWTDIYGLGATLYRAVTGEKPQESTDRMLEDTLEPAAEKGRGRYPVSLLAAIDAAMAVRPEQRPQSVAKWRQMISVKSPPLQAKPEPKQEPKQEPKPVPKPDPRPLPNPPAGSSSRKVGATLGFVVVILGIIIFLNKSPSPTPTISSVPTPIANSQPSDAALGKSRDCDVCPEMVVIPAGSFSMGSPATEAGREAGEGPLHQVKIARSFSVGKFEVTSKEWDACLGDGVCKKLSDGGEGRGDMPLAHVAWLQAQAYTQWLSKKTGKAYRLLSEAEWEYVARANSSGAYSAESSKWAEADVTDKLSQYAWFVANSEDKPNPVGKKNPNYWGLHDIQGNVMEWTHDCWNENYRNAKADGSPTAAGDCERRVVRGGAWNTPKESLRVSKRMGLPYEFKALSLGFRVARTD